MSNKSISLGDLAKKKLVYEHHKDSAQQDRHATVTTNNNIVKIQQILQIDASYTVRQLFRLTNLSLERVHVIWKKNVFMLFWKKNLSNAKKDKRKKDA